MNSSNLISPIGHDFMTVSPFTSRKHPMLLAFMHILMVICWEWGGAWSGAASEDEEAPSSGLGLHIDRVACAELEL